MARALNQKIIENLKPNPAKRVEIPDGALVGLYLVIQPSGARSWAVRYRADGKPRKLTLAPFPRMGLADARKAAGEALRIVSEGGDPAGDRITLAKLKGMERAPDSHRFGQVLERFLTAQERRGRRSTGEMRRILERDALPRWRNKPVAEITGADVVEAIEAIVARGSPVAASRFRAWCSKLFAFAVAMHLRPDNPAKGTENPISVRDIQRDRRLTDHELSLVWRCAEQLGPPFGSAVQLLVVTGQRRSEVFEATWGEFTLDTATWTIRSTRSKNGAEHIVPLSDMAVDILRRIPRMAGSPFVFTTTGSSPVSGISKAKAKLDQLITAANGGKAIPPWRMHDLRRTFVSGCARLRIPSEVTERAINHVSESFGGVRGVYNVHAYEEERRSAMQAWANHVISVASTSPKSVDQ
ncbi:tyrosine-type recombinase/integrase [Microvirga lotononidis]|uniref:Site-specific recombinase XerD n=1 Tax=Microvirga lotononidis TaxID=864069 RepID=I4YS89_9HYPH|nr:site-specific integrase [Microvirga lotononidis]EIM26831.1 site-specific recombinase XerD [Microvirga lotononidis]WQO31388.1 integrase arm-type DNA-binding domain-containing protein [Microvirga lotononidis]